MLRSCTSLSAQDVSALSWHLCCFQMSEPVWSGQRGGRKEWLADPGGWSPIDSVSMGTGVSARRLKRRVRKEEGNATAKQWLWVFQSHTNKRKNKTHTHTPPAAWWVVFHVPVLTVQMWVVSRNLLLLFVCEIPTPSLVSVFVREPSRQTSCHIPSFSG